MDAHALLTVRTADISPIFEWLLGGHKLIVSPLPARTVSSGCVSLLLRVKCFSLGREEVDYDLQSGFALKAVFALSEGYCVWIEVPASYGERVASSTFLKGRVVSIETTCNPSIHPSIHPSMTPTNLPSSSLIASHNAPKQPNVGCTFHVFFGPSLWMCEPLAMRRVSTSWALISTCDR